MPSCYAHARNNELWLHKWSAEEEEIVPRIKKLDISLLTSEKHVASENLWNKEMGMPLHKRKKGVEKIGVEIFVCDMGKGRLSKKR